MQLALITVKNGPYNYSCSWPYHCQERPIQLLWKSRLRNQGPPPHAAGPCHCQERAQYNYSCSWPLSLSRTANTITWKSRLRNQGPPPHAAGPCHRQERPNTITWKSRLRNQGPPPHAAGPNTITFFFWVLTQYNYLEKHN